MKQRLRTILKWARRDKYTKLLLLANLVALLLIISFVLISLPSQVRSKLGLSFAEPVSPTATPFQPAPTFVVELPITPIPPTVNPTRLAALPNQGSSSAPSPPPNLLFVPGTNSIITPSVTPER